MASWKITKSKPLRPNPERVTIELDGEEHEMVVPGGLSETEKTAYIDERVQKLQRRKKE